MIEVLEFTKKIDTWWGAEGKIQYQKLVHN
jgi:hypothetical protein